MLDETRSRAPTAAGDFVQFFATGERVKGEYRCAECGYGVAVWTQLPPCPMCGGESWEQGEWSPFSRARAELL
jgi:rubrerythrin